MAADQWYKGNTHTHTWWSDGNSPPEISVKWYKEHGYQFLVLSDHNVLVESEKWVALDPRTDKFPGRLEMARRYEKEFPAGAIQKREREGSTEYRLKTLPELKAMFEKHRKFLIIPGEEITDRFEKKPVHLNAFNAKELITPQQGSSVSETLQRNLDAVLAQRKATGQPMLAHMNHPNFGWGLSIEDMVALRGVQFFEVYNGHPSVNNEGDQNHPSTDRMWDVILTRRLGEFKLPVMYGLATDDAHHYDGRPDGAGPGRGWIMVHADELTPAALVKALEAGSFYATTGVTLKSVQFKGNRLTVEIDPKPGVTYKTQFIGTPRDYDRTVTARPAAGDMVLYDYGEDIGKVFDEQTGTRAGYKLTGKELYVRAKVISSAPHENSAKKGEFETAWTQPVHSKK